MKIATLNLWRYYDWDRRQDKILDTLRELKPDIIALQEVQLNQSFNLLPQSSQIAKSLGYEHYVFAPTSQKSKQIDKNGKFTQSASHGLAIISKYPILTSETVFLKKYESDKELRSILLVSVLVEGSVVNICNVHFENSDSTSKLHLDETISRLKDRNIETIVLGDFNIFDLDKHKDILSDYNLSSDITNYISYPKDNGSLDYIILPKNMQINDVNCSHNDISDHRLLLAEVSLVE